MGVTRDDVARRAGVSTAVVSYVLNEGPRPVSAQARARVLAAVAELGYRPDAVARSLRAGRTRSLGLVVPDIGLPYFGRMTQAVSAVASARGYQLLVAHTGWDVDLERARLRALAERRVDGIILMSVDPRQDPPGEQDASIPITLVDRPEFAVDGTVAATEHLLAHGHRRVALVRGPEGTLTSDRRAQGWAAALAAARVQAQEEDLVSAPVSQQGGYDAVGTLLRRGPVATALVLESDVQAMGALRRLHEEALRIPADIAIATADGTELAPFTVPSLTSLVQPTVDIAEQAVDAVLRRTPERVRLLNVRGFDLVVRESCGC